MSDTNPAIRRYPLTDSEWTIIVAPAMCNTFYLREADGKAFLISSDIGDPAAYDQIVAGSTFTFDRPFLRGISRYKLGDPVIAVTAVDGKGATVVAYFGY